MAIIRRRRGSVSTTTVTIPAMTLSYIALFAWTFVVLFPLYWLAITAFKTPLDVNGGPFCIPWRDFQPTLDSWHYIFFDLREDTFRPYLNTLVVGLTSTAITVLLGSMAAYALVRMRYRVGFGAIGSFVVAVAIAVVLLIGAAADQTGIEKSLRASSKRARQLSLFTIGCSVLSLRIRISFNSVWRQFKRLRRENAALFPKIVPPRSSNRNVTLPLPHGLFCTDCGWNGDQYGWPR